MLNLIFALILLALLISIAIIDHKTQRIPDLLNLALAIAGLAMAAFTPWLELEYSVYGGLTGFGLTFLTRAGYRWFKGFHGLGLGDVKMAAAGGFWVGIQNVPAMLFIAATSGLVIVLITGLIKKDSLTKISRIAFGPWLAIGIVGVLCLKQYGYQL